MKITAIRFEPGTITPDLKRLDVVREHEADLSSDDVGVWIGNVRIPWHRVQSMKCTELELPDAVVLPKLELEDLKRLADEAGAVLEAKPEAPPAAPKWAPRKRK